MTTGAQPHEEKGRAFWALYTPMRAIVLDFFRLLPDELMDYRMVDRPGRRSDSPRESLAHILGVQRCYLRALEAGRLSFSYEDRDAYLVTARSELIAALEALDARLLRHLADSAFRPDAPIIVPWSEEPETAIAVLHALRDHDLLHIGWNLALMDHVAMPRFPSLVAQWGG